MSQKTTPYGVPDLDGHVSRPEALCNSDGTQYPMKERLRSRTTATNKDVGIIDEIVGDGGRGISRSITDSCTPGKIE